MIKQKWIITNTQYALNAINKFIYLTMSFSFFNFNDALQARCKNIPEQIITEDISYSIIDKYTKDNSDAILDLLTLQGSLIVDNHTTNELSMQFVENGFLTLRKTATELEQTLLNGGLIILARHQQQLVGYLILAELEHFFSWLSSADKVEIDLPLKIDELEQYYVEQHIKRLSQIAVATNYVKNGIGKRLVQIAKELSPHGLSTSILSKPFTNNASFAFFNKQGFKHVAKVHVMGGPLKQTHQEIYIELWTP